MQRLLAICLVVLLWQEAQAQTRMHINGYPLTGSYKRLTRDFVDSLFKEIKSLPTIEYRYTRGGCDYRAHALYLLLKQRGVPCFKIWNFASAKVFLSGVKNHHLLLRVRDSINISTVWPHYRRYDGDSISRNVYWGYHVAPVLLAKNGSKTDTLVIDPALYDRPVSYKEWVKKPLQPGGSSYIAFLNGNLISFQTQSQYALPPSKEDPDKKRYCNDCSGSDIITGIFWTDEFSISNKHIEQSLAKGRIFIEYYDNEIVPVEQKLARIMPNLNDPLYNLYLSDLAQKKRFISAESGDKAGIDKLPEEYKSRYNAYVNEATTVLFKKSKK